MSYIGDTPWKKLKKLFMISTDLIKHYGIRYFIYVMRAEYEKKGFSMFNNKTILYTGRVHPEKGLEILINSMKYIEKNKLIS